MVFRFSKGKKEVEPDKRLTNADEWEFNPSNNLHLTKHDMFSSAANVLSDWIRLTDLRTTKIVRKKPIKAGRVWLWLLMGCQPS